MYWHESIPETRLRVLERPSSISKDFSAASVVHLVKRLDDVEDSYDAMVSALCYASQLLGRPSNELYTESHDRNKWPDPDRRPLSCKRY